MHLSKMKSGVWFCLIMVLIMAMANCGGSAGSGVAETAGDGADSTATELEVQAGNVGVNDAVKSVISNLGLSQTSFLRAVTRNSYACDNGVAGNLGITINDDSSGELTYTNCAKLVVNSCDGSSGGTYVFDGSVSWTSSTNDPTSCDGVLTFEYDITFTDPDSNPHKIQGTVAIDLGALESCDRISCEDYESNLTIDGAAVDLCAESSSCDSTSATEETEDSAATEESTCSADEEAFSGEYALYSSSCANDFESTIDFDLSCSTALGHDEMVLSGSSMFATPVTANYTIPFGSDYYTGQYSSDVSLYANVTGSADSAMLMIAFYDGAPLTGDQICSVFYSKSSYSGGSTTTYSEPTSGGSSTSSWLYLNIYDYYVYAYDGTYLGTISDNAYDSYSMCGNYNSYGGSYGSYSIFNNYGSYGSSYGSYSAFNDYASYPPIIYDSNGTALYYLTTNEYNSPRIDPYDLIYELNNYGCDKDYE